MLSGKPFFMRLFTGLFKPKTTIIGTDFAGEVEAVGAEVAAFKPGLKVMGFGGVFGCGAHAQYFVIGEEKAKKLLVVMPSNITFTEAAGCLEVQFMPQRRLMPSN